MLAKIDDISVSIPPGSGFAPRKRSAFQHRHLNSCFEEFHRAGETGEPTTDDDRLQGFAQQQSKTTDNEQLGGEDRNRTRSSTTTSANTLISE